MKKFLGIFLSMIVVAATGCARNYALEGPGPGRVDLITGPFSDNITVTDAAGKHVYQCNWFLTATCVASTQP